jgi:membrane-associated phospholipid phosphatase
MAELFKKHKSLWREKSFRIEVFIGLLLLVISLFVTYGANYYASIRVSNPVTDILLDNLPVVNVDFEFNEGPFLFSALILVLILYEPRRIPFVLKSVALFIIVRSFFVMMTHIAPPVEKSFLDSTHYLFKLSSGDDLFFSIHTGLPFLMAIIFWENKFLKYFFFAATVAGGVIVLLGHLHYSIDVFSSLFIAYGVYHIAKRLFHKDFRIFTGKEAVFT